jgi:antirestriction protein
MFEKEVLSSLNGRPENWAELVGLHKHLYNSGNPALYVGTYKKYNEGSLYGMWVDLTSFDDYDDFMEFCQLLHVDEEDPEFMYQDYENFPADYYSESCLDEFEFDKIIEFAEMDEDDKKIFEAYHSYFGGEKSLNYIKERFHGFWDSEEEFAEHIVQECYDLPDFALRYFDYEQFARDLFMYDYEMVDDCVFSVC